MHLCECLVELSVSVVSYVHIMNMYGLATSKITIYRLVFIKTFLLVYIDTLKV